MNAEQTAEALLQKAGVEEVPVDVEAIAATNGIRVIREALEDTVSGLLVVRGGRATIAVNTHHHPHRQRFTISHELGHFLLHRSRDDSSVFVDSTLTFYRDQHSADGVYSQEVQANAFAAALLMPAWAVMRDVQRTSIDVHDEISVARLASQYGVSAQAFTIRLVNLGLISMG